MSKVYFASQVMKSDDGDKLFVPTIVVEVEDGENVKLTADGGYETVEQAIQFADALISAIQTGQLDETPGVV